MQYKLEYWKTLTSFSWGGEDELSVFCEFVDVPFSAVRAATFYVHCRMDAPPVFDAWLTEDEVHQLHFPTARPRFSSAAGVVAVLAVFWALVLLACWHFQLFPFN